MSKNTTLLMPKSKKILKTVGEQFKLARLRRKLSAEIVAERAGISRATLWAVENGRATVAIGSYIAVLASLGLQNDFLLLAKDDVLGRTYQDLELPLRKRAPKTEKEE